MKGFEPKRLDLDDQQLTSVPESVAGMAGLEEVNLWRNELASLPDFLWEMHLTHLDLRNNRLASLPAAFAGLESLEFLDLRQNKLTAVPEEVRELPRLRKLDLRWNKVRPLPDWITRLERNGCTVYW